ncbi:MAG: alpha-ketoglutarate-dependent dioxygenase AlkB [Cyclobacteriaceae bacterium]|nr:alpha-ketoglutarate-dependent dioxygenase AlkB [Cyclobacteriaceae bacterium]
MQLFKNHTDPYTNLLPYQGCVNYYGLVLSREDVDYYFNRLMNYIQWEHDKALIFGKTIITKRKVAWYGDRAFDYTYSKTTKKALPWTKELLELKKMVEEISKESYNSCLLNLYHNGSEGMAWHSDGEKDLKRNGAIGSLSLGAERKFSFKHKQTKETVSIVLEHGSLLVMKGTTQSYWQHRLPPTTKIQNPRINLTFRTIVN